MVCSSASPSGGSRGGSRRGRARARARLALSRTCAARALRTHLRPAWARVCRGGLPTPRGGLQTLRVPQPQQQQLVRLLCSVFCSALLCALFSALLDPINNLVTYQSSSLINCVTVIVTGSLCL